MNPTYVVLIVNLIIWTGIFSYIFVTNKELKRLAVKIDRLSKEKI